MHQQTLLAAEEHAVPDPQVRTPYLVSSPKEGHGAALLLCVEAHGNHELLLKLQPRTTSTCCPASQTYSIRVLPRHIAKSEQCHGQVRSQMSCLTLPRLKRCLSSETQTYVPVPSCCRNMTCNSMQTPGGHLGFEGTSLATAGSSLQLLCSPATGLGTLGTMPRCS